MTNSMYLSFLRNSFFGLMLVFLFNSCENTDAELKALSSKALRVEEAKVVNVNYTIGGKIKATLSAPIMLRVQDSLSYVEFPQTLHVDFYDVTGKIESKLDAQYGKYYETQSKVFLKDSVRVINIKADTLYCDELWWDRMRTGTEFFTEKPVRIRTPIQILNGIGMEARQDFKEWHIIQSTGIIKVPAAEFPDQ